MAFDNAWIGYENLLEQFQNSLASSSTDSGFDVKALSNWFLWDRWQGNPGTWVIAFSLDCGVAKPADYLAIAGHNVVSTGASVRLVGSNVADFSTSAVVVTYSPTAGAIYNGIPLHNGTVYYDGSVTYLNEAPVVDFILGFSFTQVSYRYWRLEYTSAFKLLLSVVGLGRKMEFERGFYNGFQPPEWNEVVETTNNKSENGVYLGRSKVRAGLRPFKINVEPVTHAWVHSVWLPFKRHAEEKPFFFAWGTDVDTGRAYVWEKGFDAGKVLNRLHASVGVSCEGVIR